ncbi:MAG: flagellar assembly peptidoglycan hydrolase FlgJ [Spongiibacteraceae bacterium]
MIDKSTMTNGLLLGNGQASVDTAQIYTDLNGVQQLKAQGKTDKAGALKNIAHQFEAMMVQMMMKSMREANAVFAEGDMTSSSDEKFYQDMFDNQLSLSLSKGRGFGIAEALMRQLQGRFADANSTKGTDATTINTTVPARGSDSIMQQVKSLVETVSNQTQTANENPRMTAAIEDAMHALFATVSDAAADTNANGATVALDGTPANFIESLRPLARKAASMLGVDADVLLSQSALETGWGQKVLQCSDGSSSFNFFNIKAGDDWHGDVVKVPTIEYQNGVAVREWASFRVYGSPEESFADYARLISENPRYQRALECAENPRAYMSALANAGYATDPAYAQKVLAVLDSGHVQNTRAAQ